MWQEDERLELRCLRLPETLRLVVYINMLLRSSTTPTQMCGSVECRYDELDLLLNPPEDMTDDDEPEALDIAMETPEQQYIWSVYCGKTQPADEEEWEEISEYCRFQMFQATGVVYLHEAWQPAADDELVVFAFSE